MNIDEKACEEIIAAARAEAVKHGAHVSIAVVDAGGNLKAFLRMDGAEIAGPVLAVDKAYTSVSNRISTQELSTLAAPGGPLYGIHANGGGRFVIFAGGVPITVNGEVVGAVGVSGGSVEEDHASATAGVVVAERILAAS